MSVRDLENSFCLRALSMIRMNSLRDFCRWFKKPEIKKDSSFCGNKCEAQTENKNKQIIDDSSLSLIRFFTDLLF